MLKAINEIHPCQEIPVPAIITKASSKPDSLASPASTIASIVSITAGSVIAPELTAATKQAANVKKVAITFSLAI